MAGSRGTTATPRRRHWHQQQELQRRRINSLALIMMLLFALAPVQPAAAQMSRARTHDSHWASTGSKFLGRTADNDAAEPPSFDDMPEGASCPLDVELRWASAASSSVYATPVITDLYSDGRRDVLVPGFVHHLEAMQGDNGAKLLGWPAFHRSTVHASPLLHDWDLDGTPDVLVATYNGEVLAFKDTGEQLPGSFRVPRLRVRRDWYKGIKPDPIDHSKPDVGRAAAAFEKLAADAKAARGGGAGGGSGSGGDAGASPKHHHTGKKHGVPPPPSPSPSPSPAMTASAPVPQSPPAPAQQQSAPAPVQAPVTSAGAPAPVPGAPSPSPGAPAGGAVDEAAVAELKRAVDMFRTNYGAAAADQLLEQTRASNPRLHEAYLKQQQAAGGAAQAPAAAAPAGGGRRRLMAAPPGDAGAAPGVEFDAAKQGLSQEALDSFEVFRDGGSADGGGGADGGGSSTDGDVQPAAATGGASAGGEGGGKPLIEAIPPGEKGEEGGGNSGGSSSSSGGPAAYDELGDRLPTDSGGDGGAAAAGGEGGGPAEDDPWQWDEEAMRATGWGWQDEMYGEGTRRAVGDHVFIDPHVLCTPAIGDLDGDGREEMVLAVSYFFDADYYDDARHAGALGGIERGKYVAGGVVAFDLHTRAVKWAQHLDMTTEDTAFRAHMFSPPTLADLDRDGRLEVIVGSSVGFVYVLDSSGSARPGWPVQMGEVQGQVLAVDADADGWLEVFAGDSLGNVALFDRDGREKWERHLASMITQGAVAGDLDGDGRLELVLGAADGRVHALRARDGADLPNFPFRTGGRVQAPVTLAPLHAARGAPGTLASRPKSMHAAVVAADGLLYIIDGGEGCAHTVDLGEAAYAAVLVDDLAGEGTLDLLVATMNGNVYSLATAAPYHPLATWTAQSRSPGASLVARYGYYGAYAAPASRAPRDVAGQSLRLSIEILDRRFGAGAASDRGSNSGAGSAGNAGNDAGGIASRAAAAGAGASSGPYNVTVVLRGVGVAEMKAGDAPVIGVADSFPTPGPHAVEIPCPRTRTTATVRVDLVDANGVHYSDEFALSFHVHFHKLLKHLVALPLVAMAVVALLAAAAAEEGGVLSAGGAGFAGGGGGGIAGVGGSGGALPYDAAAWHAR